MRKEKFFSGQDRYALRRIIHEKTGYMLRENTILSQAFRRSSYCVEDGGKSNEMFEFIGDQVLSYFVVKIVSQRCVALNLECDYTFRIRQNQFSGLKQELLSNETFAKIIDEWGVADYLIVGKTDEKNQVNKQIKVKADLFEAIIGAIALESNWDPVILENVVNKALDLDGRMGEILQSESGFAEFDVDNAVTKLKELAEKELCSPPQYDIGFLGYNGNGDPVWVCTCTAIKDITGIIQQVYSSSKRDAKKAAAYLVLCQLFETANKYGKTQRFGPWIYKNGKLWPGTPEWRMEKDGV